MMASSAQNPLAPNPLASDLDEILRRAGGDLEELRGRRLFITGGTRFFGAWILETLAWANRHQDLNVSALLLTRDPAGFSRRFPHLAACPEFKVWEGDVKTFAFPEGRFTHVIHGATTSAEETFAMESPLAKFDTLTLGTRRVLDFTLQSGAEKFLFTSSGAVYDRHRGDRKRLSEEDSGAPMPWDMSQALGQSKRAAEFISAAYAEQHGLEVKLLRGFSFVGPHLSLNVQYAIGNFIRDALRGECIQLRGDGTPRRSYLYAADLMVWLWKIFMNGKSCRPYNVGSEHDLSIAELAELVRHTLHSSSSVRLGIKPSEEKPEEWYVPCTRRARSELQLEEFTPLPSAILKTAEYAVQSTNR